MKSSLRPKIKRETDQFLRNERSRRRDTRSPWPRIPAAFFEKLFPCCSSLELCVLGNLIADTVGHPLGAGPEWIAASEKALAKYSGATDRGVSNALDRLAILGAIETRRTRDDRRAKEYRVIVDAFAKVVPANARRLAAKEKALILGEAVPAASPSTRPVQLPLILFSLPGRAEPIRLPHLCHACEEKVALAIEGEDKQRRPTPIQQDTKEIPEVDFRYSEAPPQLEMATYDLLVSLEPQLGTVPGDLAVRCAERLAVIGLNSDHLAMRIHQRRKLFEGRNASWGGVLCLMTDLERDAKRAAQRARGPQTAGTGSGSRAERSGDQPATTFDAAELAVLRTSAAAGEQWAVRILGDYDRHKADDGV